MAASPAKSLKRERDEDDPNNSIKNSTVSTITSMISPPVLSVECSVSDFASTHANISDLLQESIPRRMDSLKRELSPARSSTGSLSDIGTHTPSDIPGSPTGAFAALNGVALPPPKRVRLTFAEKETKRILKEVRDREKADGRAKREAERREKEVERAKRDAEREVERHQREAEREAKRQLKEAEEVEKEKKRQAREDDKRKKEEEKQKEEEEKKKKERSQLKLNAFFKLPTKPKESGSAKAASPMPSTVEEAPTCSPSKMKYSSDFEKAFPLFFVQTNVKLAPITRFERDEQAAALLEATLDRHICGSQSPGQRRPFNTAQMFKLSSIRHRARGKQSLQVKDIMAQVIGGAGHPIDLTTESQNTHIKHTRDLLRSIPYKFLHFAEDVRPPYTGTYSKLPLSGPRKLARNPKKRDLPNVDYDYDSEAEWEEPGEDEEEIMSEGEDEEEVDVDEDLDGFLDDADDTTSDTKKSVSQGDLEPKSTGLCWEDEKGQGQDLSMYSYVMEVIHENLQVNAPIDPFATHYWERPIPVTKTMDPPRIPLNILKGTSSSINGPGSKPVKMFGASNIKPAPILTGKAPKKSIVPEDMAAFKAAVQGSDLSKVGLVEVLHKQFPKNSKAAVKGTLETHAQRLGGKEVDKRWVWMEDQMSEQRVASQ